MVLPLNKPKTIKDAQRDVTTGDGEKEIIKVMYNLLTKCVYVTANRKEEEKESENWNRGDGSRF